jgi:hypothetical protein
MDIRIRILALIFGCLLVLPGLLVFKGAYVSWHLVVVTTTICGLIGSIIGKLLTRMHALAKRVMISGGKDMAWIAMTIGTVACYNV